MDSLPGLIVFDDFLNSKEEKKIISHLDGKNWSCVGNLANSRLVQQYGYEYDYKTRKSNSAMKADPIPPIFDDIVKKIRRVFSKPPEQVIINQYLRKQGISAHVDSLNFGPIIATISLGDEAMMIFKNKKTKETVSVPLIPRRAIFMTGDSRYEWTHEIPSTVNYIIDGEKKKRGENWRRISLTFRTLNK
jgi:alkylated DNA repair dioxygenase AlkB